MIIVPATFLKNLNTTIFSSFFPENLSVLKEDDILKKAEINILNLEGNMDPE